jgi:hypothetical protein
LKERGKKKAKKKGKKRFLVFAFLEVIFWIGPACGTDFDETKALRYVDSLKKKGGRAGAKKGKKREEKKKSLYSAVSFARFNVSHAQGV